MKHRAFEQHPECQKCGKGAQSASALLKDETGEFLQFGCWACGFRWTTQTKDAPGLLVSVVDVTVTDMPSRSALALPAPPTRRRSAFRSILQLLGLVGRN